MTRSRNAGPEDEPTATQQAPPGSRNEVLLVGRVAAVPQERELPSGDLVCTWRLVVDRAPPARPRATGRAVVVDTLDCAAWTAAARRTARLLREGDVVEVQGALRRRFWRAGGGPTSRCEVEVEAVRRLARGVPRARRRAGGPSDDGGTAQA